MTLGGHDGLGDDFLQVQGQQSQVSQHPYAHTVFLQILSEFTGGKAEYG